MVPVIAELAERFDVPRQRRHLAASVAAAASYEAGACVGNDISGFADPEYLTPRPSARARRSSRRTSDFARASPTPILTTTT